MKGKQRTPADIVMDITVNEMSDPANTNYIHFGFDTDRNNVISGDHAPRAIGSHSEGTPGVDWSVTLRANGTRTVVGSVPESVARFL